MNFLCERRRPMVAPVSVAIRKAICCNTTPLKGALLSVTTPIMFALASRNAFTRSSTYSNRFQKAESVLDHVSPVQNLCIRCFSQQSAHTRLCNLIQQGVHMDLLRMKATQSAHQRPLLLTSRQRWVKSQPLSVDRGTTGLRERSWIGR